ncbi:MAG: GntR family transcriptional regulator [Anaerolineaceae bacterium]|nr:GntR family transcriptional regulator [Anaerolineaceae bacterium]
MKPSLSMAEQAYNAIKRDILTCELEPGAQVAQSQLMERYQLGTTPIREALKRLEQEGYVSSIPRLGFIISPMTISDVHDLYELRIMLEQQAIRLAVLRATDEQIKQLQQKADFTYRYKDLQSYQEFLAHNTDFHQTLALASGNRKLAAAVAQALEEMARIFHLGLEVRDSAEEMRHEHQTLVKALMDRDASLAQQLMNDQILRSQQRVMDMLNQHMKNRSINELPILKTNSN